MTLRKIKTKMSSRRIRPITCPVSTFVSELPAVVAESNEEEPVQVEQEQPLTAVQPVSDETGTEVDEVAFEAESLVIADVETPVVEIAAPVEIAQQRPRPNRGAREIRGDLIKTPWLPLKPIPRRAMTCPPQSISIRTPTSMPMQMSKMWARPRWMPDGSETQSRRRSRRGRSGRADATDGEPVNANRSPERAAARQTGGIPIPVDLGDTTASSQTSGTAAQPSQADRAAQSASCGGRRANRCQSGIICGLGCPRRAFDRAVGADRQRSCFESTGRAGHRAAHETIEQHIETAAGERSRQSSQVDPACQQGIPAPRARRRPGSTSTGSRRTGNRKDRDADEPAPYPSTCGRRK